MLDIALQEYAMKNSSGNPIYNKYDTEKSFQMLVLTSFASYSSVNPATSSNT